MASASLKRSRTAGSTKTKFTVSMWVKRSSTDAKYLMVNYTDDSNRGLIQFGGNNEFLFQSKYSNSNNAVLSTNRYFRDTSAWYHFVLIGDSTLATAGDRLKLYVNGVRETSFASETQISQDGLFYMNEATTNGFRVGEKGDGSDFFDGYLSHVIFLDGVAAAHTAFGETDATTGIWKPKVSPSVTYGTNGFFLKFDNSANMGLDSSGQGNNLTTTGSIIQTKDTPSNVFATLNPLAKSTTSGNYSNVNLTFDRPGSSASWVNTVSTLGASSGKYYWEYKVIDAGNSANGCVIGFMNIDGSDFQNRSDDLNQSSDSQNIGWYPGGNLFNQVSTIDTFNTYTDGDIIQLAMDLDNGYLYWGKNGTWENSANPTSGSSGTGGKATSLIGANGQYVFSIAHREDGNGSVNFGNGFFGTTAVTSAQNPDDGIGIFEYDPPAGYRALCTKSINAEEYS